jgi:DNA-directed RNA polymerase subunit N (RpoN/RPB10)
MAQCVTCGSELHPERAEKYDYCTRRECRERNARPLEIVAVAVNKAADQYLVLNERTKEDLAAGRYQDQRKSSAVTDPATGERTGGRSRPEAGQAPGTVARPGRRPPAPKKPDASWSRSQQELALIYNARGMRPDEIAAKLGLSRYTVTQMILTAKSRVKL